jgi:hypothetical protein
MSVELKNMTTGEVHLVENATIEELMIGLRRYYKELERQKAKSKRRYVPTGNPMGRPKKTIPPVLEKNEEL